MEILIKVLVVENNPTITRLLTYHLEQAGCLVESAEDGLAALLALERYLPDIIISDIIMPKIGGDQLCRILRRDNKFKDIYIVIFSSITIEDSERILDFDADIYITKDSSEKYVDHINYILDCYENGQTKTPQLLGGAEISRYEITTELLLARRHHLAIFDNITDAVLELDSQGKIIQANKAAQNLLKQDVMALLSTRLTDYIRGADYTEVKNWLDNVVANQNQRFDSDYISPLQIGEQHVTLSLVSMLDEGQVFVIAILQNVTTQKQVEHKLEVALLDLDAVIESIDYGVLLLDSDLKARIVNRAFREMWQISQQQVAKQRTMRELIYLVKDNNLYDIEDDDFDDYVIQRVDAVKAGPVGPLELTRKDGKVLQYQCVELPDNGRMLTYFDITNHKKTEEALAKSLVKVRDLANHDPLTGLPNSRLVRERLKLTIGVAKRKKWRVAVLFIDLDGFKEINDSFGHEAGDQVLRVFALRMKEKLRNADTAGRIGGDEFLVIQSEVAELESVELVARKVMDAIEEPFSFNEGTASLSASIGIALYPDHGDTYGQLLKIADQAMYTIKKSGKRGFCFGDTSD